MKTYQAQPLDLMQYINRKSREPHISMGIMLKNPINMERLKNAVDKLLCKFPILKCSYDPERNLFVEIPDFDSGHVIVADPTENTAAEEYLQPLGISKRLIRIAIRGNLLYITASHMVCDGSSFKSLVYMLCDIYNGNCTLDTEALMKRDFTEYFTGAASPEEKEEMLAGMRAGYKNPKILSQTDGNSLYKVEYQLGNHIMASIRKRVKATGATLNDVFLAAYARTIYQMTGAARLEIPVTSDLRKHTGYAFGICNLTGNYNLYVEVREEPFTQTLHSVSGEMRKLKNGKNDVIGPKMLVEQYKKTGLSQFIAQYEKMNVPYTNFTNFGLLDYEKLFFCDNEVTDASAYSLVEKPPYFQTAVSSFCGNTTVSCLVRGGDDVAERVRAFIKTFGEDLESFASGGQK